MGILINGIVNCEFEYECDIDWDQLELTANQSVRHCTACKKDVELCINQKAIDKAYEEGKCIAHPIYTQELISRIKAYEAGNGEYPFTEIKMPLGLPKRK